MLHARRAAGVAATTATGASGESTPQRGRFETRSRAKDDIRRVMQAFQRVRRWEKRWTDCGQPGTTLKVYKWVPVPDSENDQPPSDQQKQDRLGVVSGTISYTSTYTMNPILSHPSLDQQGSESVEMANVDDSAHPQPSESPPAVPQPGGATSQIVSLLPTPDITSSTVTKPMTLHESSGISIGVGDSSQATSASIPLALADSSELISFSASQSHTSVESALSALSDRSFGEDRSAVAGQTGSVMQSQVSSANDSQDAPAIDSQHSDNSSLIKEDEAQSRPSGSGNIPEDEPMDTDEWPVSTLLEDLPAASVSENTADMAVSNEACSDNSMDVGDESLQHPAGSPPAVESCTSGHGAAHVTDTSNTDPEPPCEDRQQSPLDDAPAMDMSESIPMDAGQQSACQPEQIEDDPIAEATVSEDTGLQVTAATSQSPSSPPLTEEQLAEVSKDQDIADLTSTQGATIGEDITDAGDIILTPDESEQIRTVEDPDTSERTRSSESTSMLDVAEHTAQPSLSSISDDRDATCTPEQQETQQSSSTAEDASTATDDSEAPMAQSDKSTSSDRPHSREATSSGSDAGDAAKAESAVPEVPSVSPPLPTTTTENNMPEALRCVSPLESPQESTGHVLTGSTRVSGTSPTEDVASHSSDAGLTAADEDPGTCSLAVAYSGDDMKQHTPGNEGPDAAILGASDDMETTSNRESSCAAVPTSSAEDELAQSAASVQSPVSAESHGRAPSQEVDQARELDDADGGNAPVIDAAAATEATEKNPASHSSADEPMEVDNPTVPKEEKAQDDCSGDAADNEQPSSKDKDTMETEASTLGIDPVQPDSPECLMLGDEKEGGTTGADNPPVDDPSQSSPAVGQDVGLEAADVQEAVSPTTAGGHASTSAATESSSTTTEEPPAAEGTAMDEDPLEQTHSASDVTAQPELSPHVAVDAAEAIVTESAPSIRTDTTAPVDTSPAPDMECVTGTSDAAAGGKSPTNASIEKSTTGSSPTPAAKVSQLSLVPYDESSSPEGESADSLLRKSPRAESKSPLGADKMKDTGKAPGLESGDGMDDKLDSAPPADTQEPNMEQKSPEPLPDNLSSPAKKQDPDSDRRASRSRSRSAELTGGWKSPTRSRSPLAPTRSSDTTSDE
eukprot:scpid27664/ scgid33994/ B-cell CLL/lymphoma 7 protein family member A